MDNNNTEQQEKPRKKRRKNGEMGNPLTSTFSDKHIRKVVDNCYGIRKAVCRKLGCDDKQLSQYLRDHKYAKEWFVESRGKICDLAEQVIVDALQNEDLDVRLEAAKFTLKHLGRHRGWSTDTAPMLQVNIEEKDKRKEIKAIFNIQDDDVIDVKPEDITESLNLIEDKGKDEQQQ